MRFAANIIAHRRLARLHRWAKLWLKWFAGFLAIVCAYAPLSKPARRIAQGWLGEIEWLMFTVVLARAAPHVRPVVRRAVADPDRKSAGVRRALMGARLRRLLRPNDFSARAAALSQDVDALVAAFLRRLPRGLTRRRPFRARPQRTVTPAPHAPLVHVFGPDTS